MKKVHIGSDHAGYALKQVLIQLLGTSYEVIDHGPNTDSSVDYPDYAHAVARATEEESAVGILICGSANGVAMTANKYAGIRAAICWKPEIASLARQHNDANVLCIPARFVSEAEAIMITETFLSTSFEGGRHANRVNKIACL